MRRLLLIVFALAAMLSSADAARRRWVPVASVARPANLMFEWHGENTTVTSGSPSGYSRGDTTATANGSVSIDTGTYYDGAASVKIGGINQNYEFAWANDIISPTQGTITFRINFTTMADQTVFEMKVDSNNRIYIDIDSGGKYMSLVRVMGGTVTRARLAVNTLLNTGQWYYVKARWDSTAHNGLYQSITCDQTIGESNSANTGTDAPGTWTGTSGTMKIGDVNGYNGTYYVDDFRIYSEWVVEPEIYYVGTTFGGTEVGTLAAPYKKHSTAVAAKCNKPFINPIYIYCSGSTDDDTPYDDSSLGQMVATSSCQLYIVGDRTSATWDSSAYTISPSTRTSYYGAVNVTKQYVNFDRVQVEIASATGGATNEIMYLAYGTVSNSIIRGPGGSEIIRFFSSINGIRLINVLAYGGGTNITSNGIKNHGVSYFYNCTIIGGTGGNGLDLANDGTANGANNYFSGASGKAIESVGTLNLTYTATSDATATGTGAVTNKPVDTTHFTAPSSGDYSLPATSGLKGAGTDVSGTESRTATDLIGATRSAPWDIGALKY